MPEFREDQSTKEWVIIASERAKRPEDFKTIENVHKNDDSKNCPFCAGHESQTPDELFAYRESGTLPNTPGWRVRVVLNKFAALLPQGEIVRLQTDSMFVKMQGVGQHEVIIESPDHNQTMVTMEDKQVEEVFLAYKERFRVLNKDPRFEVIILFKNYGFRAGTSLSHPHSQLIAMPIVPQHIRLRIEQAMRYFDEKGSCVYCDMMKSESRAKERIIMETKNYLVFDPFASGTPFETWIMPKKHNSNFDDIAEDQCRELARVARQVLIRISKSLNDPDYNLVLFSAPTHERNLDYYHWHVKILPRVAEVAGFEIGSGMNINTAIPEEAAQYLRESV